MADSTSFNPEALRPAAEATPDLFVNATRAGASRTARKEAGRARRNGPAGVIIWAALPLLGVAALGPMLTLAEQESRTWMLLQKDNPGVAQAIQTSLSVPQTPDYLEILSELSLQLAKPDLGSAYAAAQAAVSVDPSRAHVWAQLAYLETQRAGGQVNAPAIAALTKSMDACPLCSQDLIAWRFNFVLANWKAIPDALRTRAFEQADLLRWNGPHAEFLAEMRVKARQAGIPFDAYRAAVKTHVRTWDIGGAGAGPQD